MKELETYLRKLYAGLKYGHKDAFEYHLVGVANLAMAKAVEAGLDPHIAYAAGLCHDVLEDFDFDSVMRSVVLDFQLPGRAVTRVFYRPTTAKKRVPAIPLSYESDFLPNIEDPENPIEVQGAPVYADDVIWGDDGAAYDGSTGYAGDDGSTYDGSTANDGSATGHDASTAGAK